MWTALDGVMAGQRYELHAHLATGGMASVFRGWDHRLRRPVAIKMLQQFDSTSDCDIERFRREARAAAALSSPHIVEVYDFFEDAGCYYLVMELVEGRNLKEHVAERGPLPAAEALAIAAQICLALAESHAQGFIHRDIKPHNILLSRDGLAKLTDFGIVQVPGGRQFTSGGMVMGTADYVSPEQAQGLPLDPASDIYSLGAVLYEMLVGAPPFRGKTPGVVAMCHVSATPTPPRALNPAIPRAAERVALRALAKDPRRRYASARTMLGAIKRALAEMALFHVAAGEAYAQRDQTAPAPLTSSDVLAGRPILSLDARVLSAESLPPAPELGMHDSIEHALCDASGDHAISTGFDSERDAEPDLSDGALAFHFERSRAFPLAALLFDREASSFLRLFVTALIAILLAAAVVLLRLVV